MGEPGHGLGESRSRHDDESSYDGGTKADRQAGVVNVRRSFSVHESTLLDEQVGRRGAEHMAGSAFRFRKEGRVQGRCKTAKTLKDDGVSIARYAEA